MAVGALLAFCGLAALGTWQLERRAWKLDLIARVDQRVHAPATVAPAPDEWPQVSVATHEYRHVRATGSFVYASQTLVQAVTELGAGFWLLTPLRLTDGSVVLINRGFVATERAAVVVQATDAAGGQVTVTGLLRLTEPGGAFLRRNDAAANRWYSRDVQAIAAARGLGRVAPYFIDADATPHAGPGSDGFPIGGLTVIAFANNHLVYALTWYTLALMVAGAAWHVEREARRRRAGSAGGNAGDDVARQD